MANIYLFKYNNYYNRLLKREETIQDYQSNGSTVFVLTNTNFNPNDGVSTAHVFNANLENVPDYAVVTEAGGAIKSRWYVMECTRTRGMQYRITLLRDVMAEYRSEIMSATAYVQKGFVKQTSPLIFNDEDMGVNQIKSGEFLLQNKLKTPWLILYLARYFSEKKDGVPVYHSYEGSFHDEPGTTTPDYTLSSLSEYKYNYYVDNGYIYGNEDDLNFLACYKVQKGTKYYKYQTNTRIDGFFLKGVNWDGKTNSGETNQDYPLYIGTLDSNEDPNGEPEQAPSFGDFLGIYKSGYVTQHGLLVNTYTGLGVMGERGETGVIQLTNENGKIIKVGDKLYRIEIDIDVLNQRPTQDNNVPAASVLGQELAGSVYYNNQNLFSTHNNFPIDDTFVILSQPLQVYTVRYIELDNLQLSYNFTYTKAITKSSSYEIIAAPLYDISFLNVQGVLGSSFKHNGNIAMQWFQNIINTYNAEGGAYDFQLVPYCPVDTEDLTKYNVVFCYNSSDPNSRHSLAIQLPTASFSQRITLNNIPVRSDLKLSNSVDLYRLVSPNGVGEYQWSVAKNGGRAVTFEVDCTLIPFNPYIKINPYFLNLYGADYNDYRGLICGGDFSMPILNNAWETYQLSNKYYQDIFNRDIAHQEFNNKYEKMQDKMNAVFGTLQGGMQGAQAGAAGGPWGMAIGAAVGTTVSAIGGIADTVINDRLRRENIQYQKDRFGYELGTIKARSESLTRSASYNVNNKYFPYVEYYTCTSVEIEAFQNKIKWNGMTVEVIGALSDYLNPDADWTYMQGEIIEIDIPEDFQLVAEINRTLRGGIRVVKYSS